MDLEPEHVSLKSKYSVRFRQKHIIIDEITTQEEHAAYSDYAKMFT